MSVAAEQVRSVLDNPFMVLGISREGLRGLEPKDALALAKVFYDFHAKMLRPDSTEIAPEKLRRWERIQGAWEALNDPKQLNVAMRQYRPMPPEKEASLAERVVTRGREEVDRGRANLLGYLQANDPIWSQGPCAIHVLDLRSAFQAYPGDEERVLEAAMSRDAGFIGVHTRSLVLSKVGTIEVDGDERRVRAVLVLDQRKRDEPADLLIRFRRAGLKLPDLSHLLPAASTEGSDHVQDYSAPPPYNLDNIDLEQFAEFGSYVSPEAIVTTKDRLALLVSVSSSAAGEPIFHIDGVLLGIGPKHND